jgi:hypothetical protein
VGSAVQVNKMEALNKITEMLERETVQEHTHLAGILVQLRTVGYTHVEYTGNNYLVFTGPHVQRFKAELPRIISANLASIFGRGPRNIDDLLVFKYFQIGMNIYQSNIEQNHDSGYLIQHKPNILRARISKHGGEYIATLNGVIKVNPGDWIITGVNGEQYPCDPEIFKKLYDVVEQEV